MFKLSTNAIAIVVLSIFATACGQATTLARDPHAGSIVLEGSYMQAMGEARVLMAEHCHGRFDVIEADDVLTYQCRNTGDTQTLVSSR